MAPLFFYRLLVLRARLPDTLDLGYFGNRHVPPGFIAGYPHLFVDLDHDHAGAVVAPHGFESALELVVSGGAHRAGTESGTQGDEIDGNIWTVQLARLF